PDLPALEPRPWAPSFWRGGRAVEGACLESKCTVTPYRGFDKSAKQIWTHAVRPKGEGHNGPSLSRPCRQGFIVPSPRTRLLSKRRAAARAGGVPPAGGGRVAWCPARQSTRR